MVVDKPTVNDTENKTEDEEIKYADVHNQSFDDIQQNANADKGQDDGTTDGDKKPDEQTTTTTTTDDKPVIDNNLDKKLDNKPAEQTTTPAPIDTEKLKSEISQSVATEVIKAMTGAEDKATTKEEKDELAELIKTAPWVLEGRNPTYNEVILWTAKNSAPMIKKQVLEELNKEAEEEERVANETRAAQEKQTQDYNKTMFTRWDGQLAQLEQGGRIPKIVNPNDQNDPGVKARVELFKIMQERAQLAAQGKGTATDNLIEVYHEEYAPKLKDGKKTDPAIERAKAAPVAGARKSVSPNNPEEIAYNEIHGSTLEDLVRQASQARS